MSTCIGYYVILWLNCHGFYYGYMLVINMDIWCALIMALVHDLISYSMFDECMG